METPVLNFELSDEQQAEIKAVIERIREAWEPLIEALCKIVEEARKAIMEFAEILARWSLKAWLLELKVPYKWADYLSQKAHWWLAFKLGFWWLERKLYRWSSRIKWYNAFVGH